MSIFHLLKRHAVLINILFWMFVIAGAVIYPMLPVDVYPDTSLDVATITTVWPGASAEDVERLVTRVIEEEIEDVSGQQRMTSFSLADRSSIVVKFHEDLKTSELDKAFDELRLALDRVEDLPEDIEEPVLTRITIEELWPLLQVAVTDEGAGELATGRIARDLKDSLRQVDGVSRVREVAVRDREIHILLDRKALQKHDLTVVDVAAALRARNLNMPAGVIDSNADEITLRTVGEVQDPEQLGEMVIVPNPGGAHVLLSDIGRVEEAFERAVWGARFNGHPCALLYVSKERAANALDVRDGIDEHLRKYRAQHDLPGTGLGLTADSTVMIDSRLTVLERNLGMGLVLVFLLLWICMGFRNSILAIIGVPFSFLCAFIFLYMIDVTINAVSVFSLVLVSGMLVDDAIVVLENIYRHVQEGSPVEVAAVEGTREVAWPVISSTLTTIAAFLPMLIMTGVVGRFFAIIPKTVAVALAASLFECILILPVHYIDWGPRMRPKVGGRAEHKPFAQSWVGSRLLRTYEFVLAPVLTHRYLALAGVAAAGWLAWESSRTLVYDMFPSDFPTFVVDFNARPGASLDETDRVAAQIYPILDGFIPDQLDRYATALGVQWNEDNERELRPNLVQIWVDVRQTGQKYHDPAEVLNRVRGSLTQFVAAHPDCGILNLRAWPIRDGPPIGKPVAIRIEHPEYSEAQRIADRVQDRLRGMPGVYDISDNLDIGPQELRLSFKEQQAAELGVTYTQVGQALRGANDGLEVGIYKDTENDEDVDIKVRLDPQDLAALDDLRDVEVSATGGGKIKLRQVADLNFDQSYVSRYHYNGRRAVQITADVDAESGVDANIVNRAVLAEFKPLELQDPRLTIHAGGQFEETQESFSGLWRSAVIALALMYLILAAQFRSYLQPVVVLMAVGFGLIGMVLGLVVYRYPFTVTTGIAMVGLSGVVVNDALVLLDFINKERGRGTPLLEALHSACRRRVRPILLTTFTTVLGLAPMALGVGGYSKIWSPFAMSMCWGLLIATGLTLVLVPAFYYITDDLARIFQRKWRVAARDLDHFEHAAP